MSAAQFEAVVEVLLEALPGVNATRYMSVAGLVVLLYDHLLLLGPEIRVVWRAKWSLTKALFLWNKYFVTACLLLNAHILSGLSSAGLSTSVIVSFKSIWILGSAAQEIKFSGSCRKWLPASVVFGISSLAVANVFIIQRVWALWGRNRTVLKILIGTFACVYIATYTVTAIAFTAMIPNLSYSPYLRTCIVTTKPPIFTALYAIPIALDVFVFALTCWNAFDRPRHKQTAITRQLVTDGVVYFISIMTLRIFNILVLIIGDVSYMQLGVYFLWAMITVIINRMLILSGTVEVHPGPDPSGRETPFKASITYYEDEDEDEEVLDLYKLPSFIEIDNKSYHASTF